MIPFSPQRVQTHRTANRMPWNVYQQVIQGQARVASTCWPMLCADVGCGYVCHSVTLCLLKYTSYTTLPLELRVGDLVIKTPISPLIIGIALCVCHHFANLLAAASGKSSPKTK